MTSIQSAEFPDELAKKLPRHLRLSATLLGRLAQARLDRQQLEPMPGEAACQPRSAVPAPLATTTIAGRSRRPFSVQAWVQA